MTTDVKTDPVAVMDAPPPESAVASAGRIAGLAQTAAGFVKKLPGIVKREIIKLTPASLVTKVGVYGSSDTAKALKKWRTPKKMFIGLGNTVIDQLAGRFIRGTVKLATIIAFTKIIAFAAVIGLVSGSFIATASVAAAAGIGTAVYAYGKDLWLAKKKKEKLKFVSKGIALKTAFNFSKGAAGATLGVWLIHTDLAQGILSPVKDGVVSGFTSLMETFNLKAPPLPKMPEIPKLPAPETPTIHGVSLKSASVSPASGLT